MIGRRGVLFVVVTALALFTKSANAQEFRMYTCVYDELSTSGKAGRTSSRPTVCSRSFTLFHAGKVYDYIDALDEVIIFEPALDRFTILRPKAMMATTVEFDQIRHKLKIARQETEGYVRMLTQKSNPASSRAAAPIRFQLNPKFDEQYDTKRKELTLSSPFLRYRARCAEVKSPEIVDKYLRYADWICQLNYVLHPHMVLPAPRLLLNDSLRRRRVIPIEVVLQVRFDKPLYLRAEHQIRWELNTIDRSQINTWEQTLKSKMTRRVTFQEYQRTILTAQAEKRR